jgi:hypothetical protein
MSKRNNVNPDHYKVAGRARQGEDILQEQERRSLRQSQTEKPRRQKRKPGVVLRKP